MRRTICGLATATLLLALGLPALGADGEHFSSLRMVRFSKPVAVPDFSLKDLRGRPVSLSQFRGKVVLLNFWFTW